MSYKHYVALSFSANDAVVTVVSRFPVTASLMIPKKIRRGGFEAVS